MTLRELEPFAFGFINSKSESINMRIAEGIYSLCKYLPLTIDTDIKLASIDQSDFGALSQLGVLYDHGYGFWYKPHNFDKKIKDYPEFQQELTEYRDYFKGYATSLNFKETWTEEEKNLIANVSFTAGDWVGHANPDFIKIANMGTDGMRQEILKHRKENPEVQDFYDASLLVLDGIDILGERFKNLALFLAKTDKQKKGIYNRIANAFEIVPKKPAYDFFTACQSFYLLFTLDGRDSPGCFDQYMIDYFKKGERQDNIEILEGLWQGFYKKRAWNLCIGGSDEDWNDLTNELSYVILDIAEKYKYTTPNLTMRCHRNTPEKFLKRAAEVIGTGIGMPALYNDEVVCPSLEALGIPSYDSHRYVLNGCNQIDIMGKSHMGLEDGEVSLLKCLEYALTNGKCLITGGEYGLKTGIAIEFKTYTELFEAYKKQVEYVTGVCVGMANKYQKYVAETAPNPLRSMLIEGCLRKGLDYKAGGPLYNHGQILTEALADTTDSLAAIKHFVFDTKKYTMAQVVKALENDYIGFEDMYIDFKKYPVKFGNDIEEADGIGAKVLEHFFKELLKHNTYRGGKDGVYGGGLSTFSRTGRYGKALGASANGRKARDVLIADSIGAVPGKDVNGPTAVIKSSLKYDHLLAKSGFVLQLKFDKQSFLSEKGKNAFLALLKTYFKNGGQQLTVNVLNPKELEDAKLHPENYKNLTVRVGGYCDYFVNLPEDLQDNIIARTSHGI